MTNREKFILVLTAVILLVVYFFGLKMMYFHQDDVDFLVAVARDWPKTIWLPVNEHVVVLFWWLYRLEWRMFGTNFAGFLSVSLLLHITNLVLAGRLVHMETKSRFFGLLTALVLAINNNWNESIWWSTGQMWLLATLFCLMAIILIRRWNSLRIKGPVWGGLIACLVILPGLSWGVGLLWPLIIVVTLGVRGKLKYAVLFAQVVLLLVYRIIAAPKMGLAAFLHLKRLVEMVNFVIVGMANTVVGRLVFPWENKPVRFLILLGLVLLAWQTRRIWSKRLSELPVSLIGASILIYSTYSLGRASFGIGQAMATRYAYLPTFFLVMAVMIVWSKIKKGKHTETVALIIGVYLSLAGLTVFGWRVSAWTKRPQMVREYFSSIKKLSADNCLVDKMLPVFINPDPTRRLSDLKTPLGLDWQSGTAEQGCVSVLPQSIP